MRGRLPIITPPTWLIAVLVVPIVGTLLIGGIADLWVWSTLGTPPIDGALAGFVRQQDARLPFCAMFAFLYGAFRATTFHPAFRSGYREWLICAPWPSRLPLPLGPVHLVWQDLWFVVPAMLMASGPSLWLMLAVPMTFMGAYSAGIILSLFATGERGIVYVLVFLAGLALYFVAEASNHRGQPWPAAVVVVLSYPLLWWGLRRSLARFAAWEWGWLSILDVYASSFLAIYGFDTASRPHAVAQLGWPFDALPLRLKWHPWRFHDEMIWGLLAGWWVYAAHVHEMLLAMALKMIFSAPLGIAGVLCFVCRPPISFWGRLRTGRWIIPRYDRCFLGPAAMFAMQWAWIDIAVEYALPLPVVTSGLVTLFIWWIFRLSAAFERFQLTGAHRIPIPFNLTMNKQSYTSA